MVFLCLQQEVTKISVTIVQFLTLLTELCVCLAETAVLADIEVLFR